MSPHVGSQQTDPEQWDVAIAEAAELFRVLEKVGVKLELINLGGGLPARYLSEVPTVARYCEAINASMDALIASQ